MKEMTAPERAGVYRLLAAVLTEPLTPPQRAAFSYPDAAPTELEVAFAQLFILPGGAPPFVGQWLVERKAEHTTALATTMSRLMDTLGLAQTGPHGQLSLDHIALVFSVLAACLEDPARRETGVTLEATLLGAWVDRFGEALQRKAPHPAYVAVGQAFVGLAPQELQS